MIDTSLLQDISQTHIDATCLHDQAAIDSALNNMATEINADLSESNPLVLCTMIGGIIPTGMLLPRLNFPLQLDYIHATRYQGEIEAGEIRWLRHPSIPMTGRTVLIIDDILDEGLTMTALIEACINEGASQVKTAVLIEKELPHKRPGLQKADYTGIKAIDKYLFGMGMDYKEYLRNCNGIYAVNNNG